MRRKAEQLELDQIRHGGRRPGAGRTRGPNPRIRHRSRERFSALLSCHVTLRVRAEVPSLRTARLVREVERFFARACERGASRLAHYSLQVNHAHLIVEAADRDALGPGMKAICARLARAVNRVFKRSGPVLADRYHVHALRTPREVRNALAYVLLNARRHADQAGRTLSRAIGIDPASSGRWFDGWRRPVGEAGPAPSGAIPVAQPRSWLLAVGWKRTGLLTPTRFPATESGTSDFRRVVG
jgi:REP element-mobilizing transposase RayT